MEESFAEDSNALQKEKLLKDLFDTAVKTQDDEEYKALKKSLKALVRHGRMEASLCRVLEDHQWYTKGFYKSTDDDDWTMKGLHILDIMDEFFMRSSAFRGLLSNRMQKVLGPMIPDPSFRILNEKCLMRQAAFWGAPAPECACAAAAACAPAPPAEPACDAAWRA